MMHREILLWHLSTLLLVLFVGCSTPPDPLSLPAKTDSGNLRVVVEIPAGTNHLVQYDPVARTFHAPSEESDLGKLEFLPHPVNVGFIPSTYRSVNDSMPIKALLMAESIPTGLAMEARPLAHMVLQNSEGGQSHYLLTIPAAQSRWVISDSTFTQFRTQHPAAQEILALWARHHRPSDSIREIIWTDEREAMAWLEEHLVQ